MVAAMRPLLTVAFLAGSIASAAAADLAERAPTPVPVFTWTGVYAGLNAGYGFGAREALSNRAAFTTLQGAPLSPPPVFVVNNGVRVGGPPQIENVSRRGFLGGGQIGYNYQITPGSGFVVGVEADLQYADMSRGGSGRILDFTGVAATPVFLFVQNQKTRRSGLDYFGTARLRVGYAFDRLLVFATGGLAYGNTDRGGGSTVLVNAAFPIVPVSQPARDHVNAGYVLGAGVEYAFTEKVSAKAEGLYVSIPKNRSSELEVFALNPVGASPPASPLANSSSGRTAFGVLRTGLNYRF